MPPESIVPVINGDLPGFIKHDPSLITKGDIYEHDVSITAAYLKEGRERLPSIYLNVLATSDGLPIIQAHHHLLCNTM